MPFVSGSWTYCHGPPRSSICSEPWSHEVQFQSPNALTRVTLASSPACSGMNTSGEECALRSMTAKGDK